MFLFMTETELSWKRLIDKFLLKAISLTQMMRVWFFWLFFSIFQYVYKHNSFWNENQTFAIHHFLEGKAKHFAFNLRYKQ